MKLTEKQKKYADLYLQYGNSQKAYREAYGREGTSAYANELLRNPKIKAYLESFGDLLEAEKAERVAKAEEVLEFFTTVMRDETADMSNRLKSAELLAKRYALFTQKVELEAKVNGNFEINILGDEGEIL